MPTFQVFDRVDFNEWQKVVNQCRTATFFHTPAWYKVFSATYPAMKIATKKFLFDDGNVAVFPLMQQKIMRGLGKQYLSSPAGCYGGWINDHPLTVEQVSALLDWTAQYFKNIVWRINPLDEKQPHIARFYETRDDFTEMLYLKNFQDEDALRCHYKNSVRNKINKGTRANFSVTLAQEWEEWEQYVCLYRKTLERWGKNATSNYPISLFEQFYHLQSPQIKLWLIKKEEQIIGGNLNFYQSQHCVEWHAAFDERFFKDGSRNTLVHHIIVDALQNGYSFYDFNPSGGHEGTRRFKQTFGTTSVTTNVIRKHHIPKGFHLLMEIYHKMHTL